MLAGQWVQVAHIERETTNDGVEQQHATPFVAKSRSHCGRATFDFSEEPLNHVVGANRFPVWHQ